MVSNKLITIFGISSFALLIVGIGLHKGTFLPMNFVIGTYLFAGVCSFLLTQHLKAKPIKSVLALKYLHLLKPRIILVVLTFLFGNVFYGGMLSLNYALKDNQVQQFEAQSVQLKQGHIIRTNTYFLEAHVQLNEVDKVLYFGTHIAEESQRVNICIEYYDGGLGWDVIHRNYLCSSLEK